MKKIILSAMSLAAFIQAKAQLFETRTTQFAKVDILDSLSQQGSPTQLDIRVSVMEEWAPNLQSNDAIETFWDGVTLGLVIYRDGKPHELIGFWDKDGNEIDGGELKNGKGKVKTPFNQSIVSEFEHETVNYKNGMKNGEVFYYCDCANVLRHGTFEDNQKTGWWKEFTADGVLVEEKEMFIAEPVDIKEIDDWIEPAHCMMRNPDEDIICPPDK